LSQVENGIVRNDGQYPPARLHGSHNPENNNLKTDDLDNLETEIIQLLEQEACV
jgi:hypothetical protein